MRIFSPSGVVDMEPLDFIAKDARLTE